MVKSTHPRMDREEANAIESLALTFDPDPLATIRRRQRQREIEEGPQEPPTRTTDTTDTVTRGDNG